MSAPDASGAAPDRRTALELAVGAFAIGWAAIFFRLAGDLSPLLGSALRLGLAFTLLSPLVLRAFRRGALGPRVRRAALVGGVLYAVHFGAWVASLRWTSVASSVTLVTATPLLLAAISIAQGRDRPSRGLWASLGVATLGVVVIGAADASDGASVLVGDALALVGAIAMALYLLLVRSLGPGLDAAAFTACSAGAGALVLALACPLAAALGDPMRAPDAASLGWIAMSALVPQGIGHTLLARALARVTPTVVGLATCAEPVLSTLLAALVLDERPGPVSLAGCAVTLAGVVLGVREGTRPGGARRQEA